MKTPMNFTNNQTAFEYALYMIASSYFRKTTCLSELTEQQMLVQYKEQKADKQLLMEDVCIRHMLELRKKLPKSYFRQEMTVRLLKRPGAPTEIRFTNGSIILSFHGVYAGKGSKIDTQLWVKKACA